MVVVMDGEGKIKLIAVSPYEMIFVVIPSACICDAFSLLSRSDVTAVESDPEVDHLAVVSV
jgi:hypothetical protein